MKPTDRQARFRPYFAEHGREAWDLEAMPSAIFKRYVEAALRRATDMDAYRSSRTRRREQREVVREVLEKL